MEYLGVFRFFGEFPRERFGAFGHTEVGNIEIGFTVFPKLNQLQHRGPTFYIAWIILTLNEQGRKRGSIDDEVPPRTH